jgi:hypothetical protein
MLNALSSDCPFAVALTVNDDVVSEPTALALPEIKPELSIDNPEGSDPDITLYETLSLSASVAVNCIETPVLLPS